MKPSDFLSLSSSFVNNISPLFQSQSVQPQQALKLNHCLNKLLVLARWEETNNICVCLYKFLKIYIYIFFKYFNTHFCWNAFVCVYLQIYSVLSLSLFLLFWIYKKKSMCLLAFLCCFISSALILKVV